jgi:type I restriction enzyme S subunit
MNKVVKIGDIASLKTGPFGTQFSAKEYTSEGIPVINVKNIGYGQILENELDYIHESTRDRLSEHILKTGDIVFGRKGSVDRHAYISENYNGWVQGSDCIRLRFQEDVNTRYISHYLKLDHVKKQINHASIGSTMASLNTDILKNIKIILPELSVQNSIESVLSSLESKVDVNSKICFELEAMAKAIYDYWFVQFDFPDENGKPYRTSGGEMVWNEQLKREIPKGWEVGRLCDIANITMGQSPTGESYNDIGDGLIFYQGRTDFGLRFPTPRMYTTAPTRFAQKGDILLSVRAPVGDLNFAMEDCCIGRGLAALNSKLGSQMHLFYTLTGFQQIFKVMDGNGTTFGSITKDILFGMAVVIPSDEILKCFDKMVKPIELKIEKCEEEIRELTKLRDWLLPMLMNGQARVE